MIDGTDEDELITFSVQDTGIGISPEATERLFQPFTQADGATDREYGGTGLGLSISRKLVEGMQGRIDFDSTPGEGSTFRFSLPLRRLESESAPATAPTRGHAAKTEGGQRLDGLRILVADDNPINLELAQAILEQQGATVTTAATGAEALSLAERQGYDLILMDVHIPVMNGVEAARRIRAGTGPNTNTPIIAVTADVMAENQQQLFHAGMSEVLLKPIDEQKLLDVISGLLTLPQIEHPTETHTKPAPSSAGAVDPDKLPIRDQEAALKTAAGNAEIANRLFEMLTSSLDEEIGEIRQLGGTTGLGSVVESGTQIVGCLGRLRGAGPARHPAATGSGHRRKRGRTDPGPDCTAGRTGGTASQRRVKRHIPLLTRGSPL